MLFRIEEELNWEDFTILFVGPLIFKVKVIRNEYLGGRKSFKKAGDELTVVRRTLDNYKKRVVEYYQNVNKKEYFPFKEIRRRTEEPIQPKINKKYENMVMKTYPSSLTEPNQQIYFKYGPYSNRSLLLRYGFAIEGNKYEHYWLSFNVAQNLTEYFYVQEKMV